MKKQSVIKLLLIAFALVASLGLIAACGGGSGGGDNIASITVTPSASASAPSGQIIYFKAIATYGDSSTSDVTSGATWSSADTGVATVDLPGKIISGTAGTTTITASYMGKSASSDLTVTSNPPTINSVGPTGCSDTPMTVTITGTNFLPSATVTLGGYIANSVNYISDTTLEAVYTSGVPSAGYDVQVTLGPGLSVILGNGLNILPKPPVNLLDVHVVSNLIPTPMTVFSEFNPNIAFVNVSADSDGAETTTLFAMHSSDVWLANVPSGLAAGTYGVELYSAEGCSTGVQLDSLTVTDDATVTVLTASPGYASGVARTRIEITSSSEFLNMPDAYISNSVSGHIAIRLEGMDFVNISTLKATVPADSPAGLYDLVVVNPDGTVGVLASAIQVLEGGLPVVTDLSPDFMITSSDTTGVINGTGFDLASDSATLKCILPNSTIQEISALVTSSTSTSAQLTLPGTSLTAGSVCSLEIANKDGGEILLNEAIGVRSPASTVSVAFAASSAMMEARRSPAMASAYVGDAGFVYAMGGDDAAGTYSSTMEYMQVDIYGNAGTWQDSDASLPVGLTNASAVTLGEYIFLVGGVNSTGVSDKVYAAHISPSADTPYMPATDFSAYAHESDAFGIDAGIWIYKVTHVDDNGNETLASEPFSMTIPSNGRGYFVHLSSNTSGQCRVYRTPAADMTADDVELLFDTDVCINGGVTDNGDTATNALITPPSTGESGQWEDIALDMNTPREGHGLVAVPKPSSSDTWLLYAIGGRDASGNYLDSYEMTEININPATGEYSLLSSWTVGSGTLSAPRADIQATYVSDKEGAPQTNGVIYIGPGWTTGPTINTTVEKAGILITGFLDTIGTYGKTFPAAGYNLFDAGGYLLACGGTSGAESATCKDSAYASETAWNTSGFSLTESKINAGATELGPYLFIAGGYTGTVVSKAVDCAVK